MSGEDERVSLPTRLKTWLKPRPLDPNTRFMRNWVIWMRIVKAFIVITFPLLMAWSEHFQQPVWLYISALCDIFSLIHVYVNAHKIQVDGYGKPITDLRVLRRQYLLKNYGLVLLLLSVPWELIVFGIPNLHLNLMSGKEFDVA